MNRDLSEYHRPLTDLFSEITDDNAFSNDQLAAFRQNGFLTGIPVLNQAQIDALREALDDLMKPEQASNELFYEYHSNESGSAENILFHALGAWRVSEAFHDLLFHPRIARLAEQLLGGPVRFWHDQLFVKPALDGGVVAWHQDYSYWTRTVPMAHLTCWIGLDDSTEDNGCVHYVPGSHKWNLLPRTDLANNMEAVFGVLSKEQKRDFKPVPAVLKAGEASFHHPLTIHGSYENRSNRPRRATLINFVLDGVRSDSNEPLLEGVPPIPRSEKIDGQFFPKLS